MASSIAVASTFTAEPIEPFLKFWLTELGIPALVRFAPYNQVLQTLLDPSSVFARNEGGLNVVLLRVDDCRKASADDRRFAGWGDVEGRVGRMFDEVARALLSAAAKTTTPMLVCVCPSSLESDAQLDLEAIGRRAARDLERACAIAPTVRVAGAEEVLAAYPVAKVGDAHADQLAHVPYTSEFFAALATFIVRHLSAIRAPRRKVIAVDCDDTLWTGVCGEAGPSGVVIDGPRVRLQEFLVAQHDSGMLLCLCSKNNPQDVAEVFAQRPEMRLRRSHFLAERLNWSPKSQNLRALAGDLGLALDSFVFLDDSPLECAEVQAACPSVLTLQLPSPAARIPHFLSHAWIFDRVQRGTAEDRGRTRLYRENLAREDALRQAPTFAAFLADLGLQVRIGRLEASQLARAAQLTQRTNQFNTRGVKRSEAEVESCCRDHGFECFAVDVSDRFGAYGLVGLMLGRAEGDTLDVETFLLSCRALGRGVEYRMLNELGRIAVSRWLRHVNIRAVRTAKNRPVLEFLERVGGSYREIRGEEFSYRFPAPFAKDAVVGAEERGTTSADGDTSTGDAPVNVARTPSALAMRIACDLSDAARIVEEVNAWKRKTGASSSGAAGEPPLGPVETSIARIWTDVLGCERPGRHDDFFERGGDSLTAVSVITRVAAERQAQLTLGDFLEAPTVAGLAACLDHRSRADGPLVVLHRNEGGVPLFCIHPHGGHAMAYMPLARIVGESRSVYGLEAGGHDAHIEEMACRYLDAVKKAQPRGPYCFAGFCYGAVVGLEMGRRLLSEGESVALLALIDVPPPLFGPLLDPALSRRYWRFRVQQKLGKQAMRLASRSIWTWPGYFAAESQAIVRRYAREIAWRIRGGAARQGDAGDLERAGRDALKRYRRRTYPGSVNLFMPNDAVRAYAASADDWRGLARGAVTIHAIPQRGRDLLHEPDVRGLADALVPLLP